MEPWVRYHTILLGPVCSSRLYAVPQSDVEVLRLSAPKWKGVEASTKHTIVRKM